MRRSDPCEESVKDHYYYNDLESTILAALGEAGKNLVGLTIEDLAPLDEFHIRGRKGTLELAGKLALHKNMRVLDVGSGLGGASRVLAQKFGCHVTGLDLSEEYCRVATMLTRLLGLDSLACYRHGSAIDMPFEDADFDVVWTQHTSMNISDKERLYSEICRVIKPGGVLAIYDILAGAGGTVCFPVPWARDPAISFLMTQQQLREVLVDSGFKILHWLDTTETDRVWINKMDEKFGDKSLPTLGIHQLMGAGFSLMMKNQMKNLNEGRIELIEAIVARV